MTSRRSSGSIRAESAVEPTRSENITVTWRRSVVSFEGDVSIVGRASDGSAFALVSARRNGGALRQGPSSPPPSGSAGPSH